MKERWVVPLFALGLFVFCALCIGTLSLVESHLPVRFKVSGWDTNNEWLPFFVSHGQGSMKSGDAEFNVIQINPSYTIPALVEEPPMIVLGTNGRIVETVRDFKGRYPFKSADDFERIECPKEWQYGRGMQCWVGRAKMVRIGFMDVKLHDDPEIDRSLWRVVYFKSK